MLHYYGIQLNIRTDWRGIHCVQMPRDTEPSSFLSARHYILNQEETERTAQPCHAGRLH